MSPEGPALPVPVILDWLFVSSVAFICIVLRSWHYSVQEAEVVAAARQRDARRRRSRASPPGDGHERAAAVPRALISDPRVQIVAGTVALMIQAIAVLRWTQAGDRARHPEAAANMLSTMVVILGLVVPPAFAPRLYRRHCNLILGSVRLAFFALPVIRDPADLQAVFEGQPSGRLLGLVPDIFTVTLGARGLALLLAPILSPLPLAPHLALAAFSVERCRTTQYMCSTPMLRHPTWRRRFAALHRLVNKLPLLAPTPMAGLTPHLECRVALSAYQLVLGLVLPSLLVAKLQAPMAAVAAEARAVAAAEAEAARRAGRDGGGQRVRKLTARRCLGLARWAAAEVESMLQHGSELLLNSTGSPLLSAMAWWTLLSLLWVAALLLEQPSLALAMGSPLAAAQAA